MIQITGTFLGHNFEMLIDEDYTTPVTPPVAPPEVMRKPEPWGRGAIDTSPVYPTAPDNPTPDNVAPDEYATNPNQGAPPVDGSSA